ncbi:DUF3987 domain-containing protein [Streptomyces eurocidicus]|uniref:DUF3987 domain-containing protein n=1 Tax=Streptomyces eurocidicus TaxID=66423 RepID=UPI001B800D65|nr:DUF3987 domain-containing protein [Streptomyces eurocidicus]
MLHVLLCGDTGEGKGQSWGVAATVAKDANDTFMSGHIINGVVGGAGLIQAIANRGGHALIVDTEYARVLRAGRRQANLSQTLRDLWDGATVATSRAKEPVEVDEPRVSIMGHITPAEFRACMSTTDRDGGSYNRLIIVPVEQIRWLSERHVMPAHIIPDIGEAMARAIRHGQRAKLVTLTDDAYDAADIIRKDLLTMARESQGLKAFAARCNEQVRRIAALFALFDLRTKITVDDLKAAAALVRYTMESVEMFIGENDAPKAKREPRSLMEKVRDRIEMYGGKATSSELLPFVGASAAEVRALPGIVVGPEPQGNGGRPAIVYRLADAQPAPAPAAETSPAPETAAPKEEIPVPRPHRRPVTPAPEKPAAQPAVPAPAREENPFRAAL